MNTDLGVAVRTSNEKDGISTLAQNVSVALSIIATVAFVAWYALLNRSVALDFRFNWYVVPYVVALIANVAGFLMLLRVKVRTEVLQWFSFFQLGAAIWTIGEVINRLSASPHTTMYWGPTIIFGSAIVPVALFMFAISYTGARSAGRPITLPALLGAMLVYMFVDDKTSLLNVYDPGKISQTRWGYVTEVGLGYFLMILWFTLLTSTAIITLYKFRQKTLDPVLRKQAKLFALAIAIPLVGGGLADGVLPNLTVDLLPPMTVLLMTVMGVIIGHGIVRYRFFSFTPDTVANQILGTMNEAVLGVLPDYRVRYVNEGAKKLLGLTGSEIANKHLSDFLAHHVTTEQLHERFSKALGNGKFATIESIDLHGADGKTITAKMSVTKLIDSEQPYGYLVVLADITALAHESEAVERQVVERTKELHEEQARLRAAIESLELGFILVGDEENIIIQNQPLQTIFELDGSVVSLGQLNDRLAGFNLIAKCHHVAETGRSFVATDIGMGPKILQIFIGPVKVTYRKGIKVIGIMLMVEDVTEEKVLARSKDEFFSIASHELRTPLTAIKGNTSIMMEYYKELVDKDESFKQMIYDIHESSGRLIDIVRDFLDVSRVEQGKMVFRPEVFDIDKVIETVFYELRTAVKGKDIVLETNMKTLGALPKVWADRNRVTQIIYNLIGNAVKFTDEGAIRVTASVEEHMVRLEIADTGRGIPLDNQKYLFHKFQQAGDSLLTRDTTRGTGLGLYISKLMAKNMGCTLGLVSSDENKGSTFYFAIPAATKKQLHDNRSQVLLERIDATTGLSVSGPDDNSANVAE